MDFCSIDLETANAKLSSICQVGVVKFRNGQVVETIDSLVNPKTYFEPMNIDIHGITEKDVQNAPLFKDVWQQIASFVGGDILVSHSAFDRTALTRACSLYSLPMLENRWVDSMRVTRRTWSRFRQSGYGLKSVAKFLEIEFEHHHAVADATACGEVLIAAIQKSGFSVDDWVSRQSKQASVEIIEIANKLVNDQGVFFGQSIVFTGALSIPRREASKMAAQLGFEIAKGVSKKIDILVVGEQDLDRLNGKEKSSKHLKAEKLINDGVPIRIVGEPDFEALTNILT